MRRRLLLVSAGLIAGYLGLFGTCLTTSNGAWSGDTYFFTYSGAIQNPFTTPYEEYDICLERSLAEFFSPAYDAATGAGIPIRNPIADPLG